MILNLEIFSGRLLCNVSGLASVVRDFALNVHLQKWFLNEVSLLIFLQNDINRPNRCLLWFILDSDLPEEHPRVSQEVTKVLKKKPDIFLRLWWFRWRSNWWLNSLRRRSWSYQADLLTQLKAKNFSAATSSFSYGICWGTSKWIFILGT